MKILRWWWKEYCYQYWFKTNYGPGSPLYRLMKVLLSYAVQEGANCVVFGEPIQPYEIQEPPKTNESQVEEVSLFIEKLEDELIEEQEDECITTSIGYPYDSSSISEIPVWYRLETGKFIKTPGLPVSLICDLIGCLGSYNEIGLLKSNSEKVKFSLGMQENYCYYVNILESH